MAELKGIDVSSYQDYPDWAKVKSLGIINYAILRIHQRYGIDSSFEHNYKGCKANGIPVGGYKFSYALNVAQAEAEADAVLAVMNKRDMEYPIFYDLEWSTQRNSCSAATITKIVDAFCNKIKAAGYKVGIYCNVDWYDNVVESSLHDKYDFWLAAYPSSDNGTVQERLRPGKGIAWQYSSNGTIPGINGGVDMDLFFKDYTKDSTTSSTTDDKDTSGGETVSTTNLWSKTDSLMASQVGYLEKASNANLDSKTGNAGYNNYTKYSRDVNALGLMGCQAQPWCSTYQFWICVQIFGKAKALEIMGYGFYNCNSVKAHAKSKGTWSTYPVVGALVIFRNGAHIGRVIKITDSYIYTNEGNTSSGGLNNVEANGGCVATKQYTRSYSGIDGYVIIDYGTSSSTTTPSTTTKWKATGTATSTVDNLYVRSTPNGEILGELMKGNRFEIDGTTSGTWTHVKVANIGVAWVATKYVKKDGKENNTTTITNKQDKTQVLFVGKVTASALNVRTWAGSYYPKIKSYPLLLRGNKVDVMNYTQKADDGDKWYYVRIAGEYFGFVHSSYIAKV